MRISDRVRIPRELKSLMPKDQDDATAIMKLRDLGFPAIEPLLTRLVKWVRQQDWPVASPTVDLFVSLGVRAVPAVSRALQSNDFCLVSRIVSEIVAKWPTETVAMVSAELHRIMVIFQLQGPDLEAASLLVSHHLVKDVPWFLGTLSYDRHHAETRIAKIDSMRSQLSQG